MVQSLVILAHFTMKDTVHTILVYVCRLHIYYDLNMTNIHWINTFVVGRFPSVFDSVSLPPPRPMVVARSPGEHNRMDEGAPQEDSSGKGRHYLP